MSQEIGTIEGGAEVIVDTDLFDSEGVYRDVRFFLRGPVVPTPAVRQPTRFDRTGVDPLAEAKGRRRCCLLRPDGSLEWTELPRALEIKLAGFKAEKAALSTLEETVFTLRSVAQSVPVRRGLRRALARWNGRHRARAVPRELRFLAYVYAEKDKVLTERETEEVAEFARIGESVRAIQEVWMSLPTWRGLQ